MNDITRCIHVQGVAFPGLPLRTLVRMGTNPSSNRNPFVVGSPEVVILEFLQIFYYFLCVLLSFYFSVWRAPDVDQLFLKKLLQFVDYIL